MRTIIAAIVLMSLTFGAIGAPFFGKSKKGPPPPPISLDQNAVLYISIMEKLMDQYADIGELDRFHYMKDEIEKAMELIDFPMEYKIQRWPANKVPAGNPELTITLVQWGSSHGSEIEVRFTAWIREDAGNRDEKKRKVGRGYFRETDIAFGFSSHRRIESYRKLFQEGIIDMLRVLNHSFEVTFEGEEIVKEAPN